MLNPPWYIRCISYVMPITLVRRKGRLLTDLILQLYQNQYMLGTREAIYSVGVTYKPFRKCLKKIQHELPHCRKFLLLGTGLGSALAILQRRYQVFPDAVLVDHDQDVLDFSIQYMQLNTKKNVQWVCQDARKYLEGCQEKFNLIGVDLFKDLIHPDYVRQHVFVEQCKEKLLPGGICIWNMILTDKHHLQQITITFQRHFKYVEAIRDGVNTYFICKLN